MAPLNARIIIVGYPRLYPNEQKNVYKCNWLSDENRKRLVDLGVQMDSELSEAAKSVGIEYVSTQNALSGHELCTKDSWINPLSGTLPGNYLSEGHPTKDGHKAIADIVKKYLQTH